MVTQCPFFLYTVLQIDYDSNSTAVSLKGDSFLHPHVNLQIFFGNDYEYLNISVVSKLNEVK